MKGREVFGLFSTHSLRQFGGRELSGIFLFNTLSVGLFLIPAKNEFEMLLLRPTMTELCKGDIKTGSSGSPYGVRAPWMSSTHRSKNQDFPLSQADELHKTRTWNQGHTKLESLSQVVAVFPNRS